jgi:hypothetical protein
MWLIIIRFKRASNVEVEHIYNIMIFNKIL